jgi:WD repeat-containing protein 48
MYQRPAVTQRISYVLRKDENRNAHLLGVNALALDTSTLTASLESSDHDHNHNHGHHHHHHHTSSKHQLPGGILYTGGRDGMIAAWDLHFEVCAYF